MKHIKKLISLLCLILICLGTQGCTNTISAMSGSKGVQGTQMSQGVDGFPDIELPYNMKPVTKETMAVRNDSFHGGIYYFKGKVNVASLRDYVNISMANNGWNKGGESTIQKHTLLVFTKSGKSCIVLISDELTSTKATLVISTGQDLQVPGSAFPAAD